MADKYRFPDAPKAWDAGWASELIRILDQKQEDEIQPVTGYSVTNMGTARRTIDFASATATEVREFIATLADDLLAAGILKS